MNYIKEIGRILAVLALQVLLFDRLHIGNWGMSMMYILCLINLPIRIPRWAEMLIGCRIGLVMDIWHVSLGVHMAACVAICFARPLLLNKSIQDLERIKENLSSQTIGWMEYAKITTILTVLHHFLIYALETWNMQFWWIIVIQTLISSALTLSIIFGYEYTKR